MEQKQANKNYGQGNGLARTLKFTLTKYSVSHNNELLRRRITKDGPRFLEMRSLKLGYSAELQEDKAMKNIKKIFLKRTLISLKLRLVFILNNHCDRRVFGHNYELKFHDQQNIVCPVPAVPYLLPADYQIVQISLQYRLLDLELLPPVKVEVN